MNLFSWMPVVFVLVFFALAKYVLKPRSRHGLMTLGAVMFVLIQTAPHFMLRFFFVGMTFAILFVGWLFGNAIGAASREVRAKSLLKLGATLLLAPLALFKLIQVVLPPQLLETVLTFRGGNVELGSLAPMGISYFTFRAIAYLIEIRKGSLKPVGWWPYLNYVAFWPTVMAGPIERPAAFFAQTRSPGEITGDDVRIGLARIGAGLFKKMILGGFFYQIAEPYMLLASTNMKQALTLWKPWQLWACLHAYYFYLYLDFAGYSDVAIGLARLFGYRIMENFRWPMLATNVADFWRRWHISLTGWITDYVYIPLGGNRRGLRAAARNTMIAMVLVGIWHSTSIHFALWGAYHAVFLILYRQYRVKYKDRAPKSRYWKLLAWFVTFQIVNLGWVLFIFSAKGAMMIYAKLFFLR